MEGLAINVEGLVVAVTRFVPAMLDIGLGLVNENNFEGPSLFTYLMVPL